MTKMTYRIKIKNTNGIQLSGKFDSKRDAMAVIKKNREADKVINQGGFRKQSTGRLVKITNKYSLVKQ